MTVTDRPDKPTIAQLREVTQPPEVRERANAEHWTASLYLRDLSPYLTRIFLRLGWSANAVTGVMIVVGILTGLSLLIPGIWGPVVALVLGQLMMLIDCCDGEVARWRRQSSPAGVFLDKIGHYTTEALIPIALGVRAAGYPFSVPEDFAWTTAGFALALVIVLNKALNDMVHVARANAGLQKLADRKEEAVPTSTGLARIRGALRWVPFHRIYHSVEMTIILFVASLLGIAVGQVLVDQIVLLVLLPLAIISLGGHFVAIMASKRVRS